jgi:hypothetical protein
MISRIHKNRFDKTKLKFLENIAMEKKKQGQARIKKTAIWFFVALACLACFNVQAAECKRYIVSPNTNSTNWQASEWTNYPNAPNCTPVTPETSMRNARAGDIVYFRGGTYNVIGTADDQDVTLYPRNSGTLGNEIEFRNYPGETPVINDTNTSHPNNGVLGVGATGDAKPSLSSSYIIINGFKTTADGSGTARMAVVGGSSHVTIKNCEIAGTATSATPGNYDGIRIESASYVTVTNCLIYGVEVKSTDHGAGIKVYNSDNIIIEKCTIHDCDQAIGIKDGSQKNFYIRYNYAYNIGIDGSGRDFIRLIMGGGENTTQHHSNFNIYQNVYDGSHYDSGAFLKQDYEQDHWSSLYIYNNTYHYNGPYGFINLTRSSTTEVYNNIIDGGDPLLKTKDSWTTKLHYYDYNFYENFTNIVLHNGKTNEEKYSTFSSWKSSGEIANGGNPDRNSIDGRNPSFVNESAGNAAGFKLQPDSPAKNAGIDRQDHDGDGNNTENINMGAYITGYEQIGCDLKASGSEQSPIEPPLSLQVIQN